ncbi:MAG: hypothetical protein NEHIOOID_00851 [Holosporales bacterium]
MKIIYAFILMITTLFSSDVQMFLDENQTRAICVRVPPNATMTAVAALNAKQDELIDLGDGWTLKDGRTSFTASKDTIVQIYRRLTNKGSKERPYNIAHFDARITDFTGLKCVFQIEDSKYYIKGVNTALPLYFIPANMMVMKTYFEQLKDRVAQLSNKEMRLKPVRMLVEKSSDIVKRMSSFYSGSLIDSQKNKNQGNIPFLSHTIIFNPSSVDFEFIRHNTKVLSEKKFSNASNAERKWVYNLWLINKNHSVSIPDDLANKIQVKYIQDFMNQEETIVFNDLKRNGTFSQRCYLSAVLLKKLGGWIIEPSVRIFHDLRRFSRSNFMGIIDPILYPCVGLNLWGGNANSPILTYYLAKMVENAKKMDEKLGFGDFDDYVKYGCCLLTESVLNMGNPSNDLILPDQSLILFKESGEINFQPSIIAHRKI